MGIFVILFRYLVCVEKSAAKIIYSIQVGYNFPKLKIDRDLIKLPFKLEREKEQEQARLERRKRLLDLVDENGNPREIISPAAANIDPHAVAAVQDELKKRNNKKDKEVKKKINVNWLNLSNQEHPYL